MAWFLFLINNYLLQKTKDGEHLVEKYKSNYLN